MSGQPTPTLYITNLETKTKKPELKQMLYALFTPYGRIIDIVALKTSKMRGQAFVVYAEQAAATAGMRGMNGVEFYGKEMRITYARTQSQATIALTAPPSSSRPSKKSKPAAVVSHAAADFATLEEQRVAEEEGRGKRALEEEEEGGGGKRRKVDGEGDDEEMEIDEDEEDEAGPSVPVPATKGPAVPTMILASNLPTEATEEVMSELFQQYPGFLSISLLQASGTPPTRSASVTYKSAEAAEVVKKALNGFTLKPGCDMGVELVQ